MITFLGNTIFLFYIKRAKRFIDEICDLFVYILKINLTLLHNNSLRSPKLTTKNAYFSQCRKQTLRLKSIMSLEVRNE